MKFTDDKSVMAAPGPGPGRKEVFHSDDDTRGLRLRVMDTGVRSWVFEYRAHGRERLLTIGRAETWPLKLVREEAHRLRRLVDVGGDPMGERHAQRAAPTMNDLIERWREERAPRKKASSREEDEAMIRDYIEPELGRMKVGDVTRSVVDRLHRKISARGTLYRANRVLALVSTLLSLAVIWEYRSDNPAKGIEKNPEEPRYRYLTPEELPRLSAALDAYPNQDPADVLRMLLLTGARKNEVLSMRWTDVYLGEPPVWNKPPSSTKQKRLHRVPLSAEAQALLLAREVRAKSARFPSPYVFPRRQRRRGQPAIGHLPDVQSAWKRIIKAARLEDIRIHDLRHSFASILASQGFSLPMIGSLLGHTQAQTTQRYSHLLDSAQRQAAEKVGEVVKLAR
jgi:integrase